MMIEIFDEHHNFVRFLPEVTSVESNNGNDDDKGERCILRNGEDEVVIRTDGSEKLYDAIIAAMRDGVEECWIDGDTLHIGKWEDTPWSERCKEKGK